MRVQLARHHQICLQQQLQTNNVPVRFTTQSEHESEPALSERPLVTFALFAYNQQAYIREAIEGAFAQTYSPLEIIISDDCSNDSTFEIARQMTEAYDGPHSVRCNRNSHNLGIGGHVQRMGDLAKGSIIVMAAGDDISLPERTASVVRCFLQNTNTMAVVSATSSIDSDGKPTSGGHFPSAQAKRIDTEEMARGGGGVGPGASYAYHRTCFHWPASYPAHLMNEDRILPMRAALLGEVQYIPDLLVNYRQSESGVSRSLPFHALMANLKPPHVKHLIDTIRCAETESMLTSGRSRKLQRLVKETYHCARLSLALESAPVVVRVPATKLLYHFRNRRKFLSHVVTRITGLASFPFQKRRSTNAGC